MIKDFRSIKFLDEESKSDGFIGIRLCDGKIAVGVSVSASGDLDILLSRKDAKEIAEGILAAVEFMDND